MSNYIHVIDLSEGQVAALNHLRSKRWLFTMDLGTECGVDVLKMIRAFEQDSGISVPYNLVDRRPSDITKCWADPIPAKQKMD